MAKSKAVQPEEEYESLLRDVCALIEASGLHVKKQMPKKTKKKAKRKRKV